jgi:hypothetical protein
VEEPHQRPPSPTPASPIFDAPKTEWDASRYETCVIFAHGGHAYT